MGKKLPIAFKRKWVAALRSGKYKQGERYLKREDDGDISYCCLGVAAEIVGCTRIFDKQVIEGNDGIRGVSKIPALIKGGGSNNLVVYKLTTKNDSGKWSFKRIASWIEKNL